MDEFHDFRKGGFLLVAPDSSTFIGDPSFRDNAGCFHDDQSSSALSATRVMHEMKIIWNTVFAGVHTHRRHYPSVAEFEIAERYFGVEGHLYLILLVVVAIVAIVAVVAIVDHCKIKSKIEHC